MSQKNDKNNDPLDIQDYLDASSEASKRARAVLIVLIVASVLVLAGLLNSLESNWMLKRIQAHNYKDIRGEYAQSFLGPYPEVEGMTKEEYDAAVKLYQRKFEELNVAFIRTYVDSSLVIRVPFFGFSFDVNDLGLLGGIGFLVILSCLRFCLSRELENLRLSFEYAKNMGRLEDFYHLLAMKQLFTIPNTRHRRINRFLLLAPKCVSILPLVVYILVIWNDFRTQSIGAFLQSSARVQLLLVFESVAFICLLILTVLIVQRLFRLDAVWAEHEPIQSEEPHQIDTDNLALT